MTLVINLLTPKGIYQSADFRLTDPKTKKPVDFSPKQLRLNYIPIGSGPGWVGTISYAGLGSDLTGKHTADVVASWLKGKEYVSFGDLADMLRTDGTKWIQGMCKSYPHTFCLAGVIEGVCHFTLVSNYQHLNNQTDKTPAPALFIEPMIVTKPKLVVVGQPLPPHARKVIMAQLHQHHNDADIRAVLGRENARLAHKNPYVSPSCLTYCLLADNSVGYEGAGEMYGKPTENLIPIRVMCGTVMDEEFMRDIWMQAGRQGPIYERQSASGSGFGNSMTATWPKPTLGPGQTPDT